MTCNVPIPSPTARSCCLPNQTNIQSSLNMEQKRQCHLKTAFESPWIEQYPDQASNTVTTAADISTSWMTDFFTTHIDRQRNSVSCVESNFGEKKAERKMKVFHFSLRPQNRRSLVTQATFSYHWLLILFSSVVICCCDSFAYSFTRNLLWVTLQDIKQLGATATTTVTLTWNLMRWNGCDGSSSYILS